MMRRRRSTIPAWFSFLALLIAGRAARAADLVQTRTESLACWTSASCVNGAGELIHYDAFSAANFSTSCSFTDALPSGSRVRALTVHIRVQRLCAPTGSPAAILTVSLNGKQLSALDDHSVSSAGTACNCPSAGDIREITSGLLVQEADGRVNADGFYVYGGGQNTITVAGSGGAGTIRVIDGRVDIDYSPPWNIDFNIAPSSPDADRRIVLSSYDLRYHAPKYQEGVTIDNAFEVGRGIYVQAHVTNALTGAPADNLTLYLRITDPPDPAPYMNTFAALAHPGDNYCPPALQGYCNYLPVPGLPSGFGARSSPSGGANEYVMTTDAAGDGRFTFYLRCANWGDSCPDVAAGDNFQFEISPDVRFNRSSKSGVVTVWKRVFVEKRRMLRSGVRLGTRVLQGDTEIHVVSDTWDPAGPTRGRHGPKIQPGDNLVLVHAPASDRHDVASGFYMEFHRVAEVHRAGAGDFVIALGIKQHGTIIPEVIQQPVYDVDGSGGQDGVGPVTSAGSLSPVTDYFDAPDTLLSNYAGGVAASAFPQAYVEYIVLPDAGPMVPAPHHVEPFGDEVEYQSYANRWCLSVDASSRLTPNHQLLIIGDIEQPWSTTGGLINAGLTMRRYTGLTSSFVWRGNVEYLHTTSAFLGPNFDVDRWVAKTEAHELAHQWHVDELPVFPQMSQPSFHCPSDTPAFNGTVRCLEAAEGPLVRNEKANFTALFHLLFRDDLGRWDSEYFTIRQAVDPWRP